MVWVHKSRPPVDDGRDEEWQANDDGHCARLHEDDREEEYDDIETV